MQCISPTRTGSSTDAQLEPRFVRGELPASHNERLTAAGPHRFRAASTLFPDPRDGAFGPMMPSLSRLFPRDGRVAPGPRRPWVQPALNATVIAVLVGPWIFATWSLIDSLLDRF